jgi:hypothetical protein
MLLKLLSKRQQSSIESTSKLSDKGVHRRRPWRGLSYKAAATFARKALVYKGRRAEPCVQHPGMSPRYRRYNSLRAQCICCCSSMLQHMLISEAAQTLQFAPIALPRIVKFMLLKLQLLLLVKSYSSNCCCYSERTGVYAATGDPVALLLLRLRPVSITENCQVYAAAPKSKILLLILTSFSRLHDLWDGRW